MGLQGSLLETAEGCRLIVAINLIGQGAAVHIDAEDIAIADSSLSLDLTI
jgi:hypothetical protein